MLELLGFTNKYYNSEVNKISIAELLEVLKKYLNNKEYTYVEKYGNEIKFSRIFKKPFQKTYLLPRSGKISITQENETLKVINSSIIPFLFLIVYFLLVVGTELSLTGEKIKTLLNVEFIALPFKYVLIIIGCINILIDQLLQQKLKNEINTLLIKYSAKNNTEENLVRNEYK